MGDGGDELLPTKSIRHIMKRALGADHEQVLTDDAVAAVQRSASEMISLVVSASRAQVTKEGRETVGYADVRSALNELSFTCVAQFKSDELRRRVETDLLTLRAATRTWDAHLRTAHGASRACHLPTAQAIPGAARGAHGGALWGAAKQERQAGRQEGQAWRLIRLTCHMGSRTRASAAADSTAAAAVAVVVAAAAAAAAAVVATASRRAAALPVPARPLHPSLCHLRPHQREPAGTQAG